MGLVVSDLAWGEVSDFWSSNPMLAAMASSAIVIALTVLVIDRFVAKQAARRWQTVASTAYSVLGHEAASVVQKGWRFTRKHHPEPDKYPLDLRLQHFLESDESAALGFRDDVVKQGVQRLNSVLAAWAPVMLADDELTAALDRFAQLREVLAQTEESFLHQRTEAGQEEEILSGWREYCRRERAFAIESGRVADLDQAAPSVKFSYETPPAPPSHADRRISALDRLIHGLLWRRLKASSGLARWRVDLPRPFLNEWEQIDVAASGTVTMRDGSTAPDEDMIIDRHGYLFLTTARLLVMTGWPYRDWLARRPLRNRNAPPVEVLVAPRTTVNVRLVKGHPFSRSRHERLCRIDLRTQVGQEACFCVRSAWEPELLAIHDTLNRDRDPDALFL